jgi:hypothetical protein
VRVALDGVDAAGKTTIAGELAPIIKQEIARLLARQSTVFIILPASDAGEVPLLPMAIITTPSITTH